MMVLLFKNVYGLETNLLEMAHYSRMEQRSVAEGIYGSDVARGMPPIRRSVLVKRASQKSPQFSAGL